MKRIWMVLFLLVVLLGMVGCGALAEETAETPVFALPVASGSVELHPEVIDEELWLFLPAFAQMEELCTDGAELEWWDMEPDEEGLWYVDLLFGEEETLTVNVMKSENLRSLFLFSDDPVAYGKAYVEDKTTKHENEAAASLVMVNAEGEISHAEHIEKLRGRGNGTWRAAHKLSYQIKLDRKVDLLDSGDERNAAKKWLLLAEAVDDTFLRNQISQDLGREIGVLAMESEFVDLYYDGSYCGTYRMSEKVEVGEGRVDMLDYDGLLETWNDKVGQYQLDTLPAGKAENRFGNEYTYIEGVVTNHQPASGGYLIELESHYNTLTDRCYFWLNEGWNDQVYALKNPENASQEMVQYISERLQDARAALRAGGMNPVTGTLASDVFDLDAFARVLLIQEWSGNLDGYTYSSSFFVLPEGEKRFLPGPLWDLDLGFRYRSYVESSGKGAQGFKDEDSWLTDFYRVPEYREIAQRIYLEEIYPLVQNVLFGEEEGTYLKSYSDYLDWIAASARMNWKICNPEREIRFNYKDAADEEIRQLKFFIEQRSAWLYNAMNDLAKEEENHISLWMDVRYGNPADSVRFLSAPWQGYNVQTVSAWQMSEAEDGEYALWQAEAVIAAEDGWPLENVTVSVNGIPVTTHLQQDGSLLLRVEYEDRTYRPVDYYGDDMGLIFDYEAYIQRYPEVLEYCDYDEMAVMDYFFDEGIYEGQMGNEFFSPEDMADLQPFVKDYLFDDWSMYYWEFLDWGYEAGWLKESMIRFVPDIVDVP